MASLYYIGYIIAEIMAEAPAQRTHFEFIIISIFIAIFISDHRIFNFISQSNRAVTPVLLALPEFCGRT